MGVVNTASGFAVLDAASDHLLSRWVERDNSLDAYDPRIRGLFCSLIPVGGVVVDGGAFIGDHTAAYAEKVGSSGRVLAFEPAPDAYQALIHNTDRFPWVEPIQAALGARNGMIGLTINRYNPGCNYVQEALCIDPIPLVALDSLQLSHLDFLKLDIEGYELDALEGSARTIDQCKPIIVVESGIHAGRYGHSDEALSEWLRDHGYDISILPSKYEDTCDWLCTAMVQA